MFNEEIRFFIAFGVWTVLCLISWAAYLRATPRQKEAVYRRICLLAGVLFVLIVVWTSWRLWPLLFVLPITAFITALNIKMSRFCPDCGAYHQHLGKLYTVKFCRYCGRTLTAEIGLDESPR